MAKAMDGTWEPGAGAQEPSGVGGVEWSEGRVAQVGVTTSVVGALYTTWSSFPVVGVGLVVSSAIEASLR
jgi:hypothetical protein